VALTNTYLYMNGYNSYYYNEFIDVTNLPTFSALAFFYED